MKSVLRGILVLAATVLAAASASAGTLASCDPAAHESFISWPDVNPVWQLCFVRAPYSSGSNGSGLEVRNVYYNGHLVMKRGHVPMLNVQYLQVSCGCNCYRDWLTQEVNFVSNNVISAGYSEPTPDCPQTVCDLGGGVDCPQDVPPPPAAPPCPNWACFAGVAAEKLPDHLTLTTQTSAGWYRYVMKWTFWQDGRIEPRFCFAAVDAGCISCSHNHHAYWRFDFDVDGSPNVVSEGPETPDAGRAGGPRPRIVTLPTETMRVVNYPGITWSITDPVAHRGYRLVPGSETALPADTFSVGDFWALRYHANELDDGHSIGDCPVNFTPWLNGESLNGDLVLWYRSGWLHPEGDLGPFVQVGPTLYPVGDWSP